MAIEKNIAKVSLSLQYDTGVQHEGVNVLKNTTYGDIDSTSTPENIFAVAYAIKGLQTKTLINVYLNEKSVLNEAE